MRRFLILILIVGGATGCKSWPFWKDRAPAERDVIAPPGDIKPFWPDDPKVSPPPPLTPPVDWSPPSSGFNIEAPKVVEPGQDVSIRLEVADPASTTVRHAVPSNVQILRTEPPARLQGSDLVWDLPPPANAGRRDVTVVYRTSTPGSISLKAEAIAANGSRLDARATTQVGVGQLALQLDGPSSARVQDRVTYDVRLANSSASAVTNVVLRTELPAGLKHETGNRVLEIPIAILQPRETKSVELPLIVTTGGQFRIVVTARGDGDVSTLQERVLNVQQTSVSISMAGPSQAILQKPGTWSATVRNEGTMPARNLQVRLRMPSELRFQQVSPGGRSANNVAQWMIESLGPGEQRTVELTALAIAPIARTTLVALLVGDGIAEQRADHGLEIIGIPLLKLTLTDSANRVEVGKRVVYTAEVRNAGSTPLEDIDIVAIMSAGLKPKFGFGPTMARIDGGRVTFGRVALLEPGKSMTFQLEAESATAGDARVTVEARSKSLPTPMLMDVATRILP